MSRALARCNRYIWLSGRTWSTSRGDRLPGAAGVVAATHPIASRV